MLGWSVWAWLLVSLLLQVGVGVVEQVAGGTAVARKGRWIADLLSAPLVRNAVRTSLAGGLAARVALAGVPVAAATPTQTTAFFVNFSPRGDASLSTRAEFLATPEEPVDDVPSDSIVYTVRPGDNLVRIAERFYGNGDKWQLLYETNQGRRMADGRTFDRAGVIQPGWHLVVPKPTAAIETDADGQRWYTVRKGDSLAGISARLLGDEQRWPELYAVNQGIRLDDRHVLRDPRLIWPGMHLRIPELDVRPSPASEAPPQSDEQQHAQLPAVVTATPTVAPSPTPVPAAIVATPSVTASVTTVEGSEGVAPEPSTEASSAHPIADTGTESDKPSVTQPGQIVSPGVGAAAGAATALVGVAGTALLLRRRHPRPPRTLPESDVSINAGYAEAEPIDELGSGVDSDDLSVAARIAARMSHELRIVLWERDPESQQALATEAMLAAVRHGRSSTTLFIQGVPLTKRQQVIEALPEAATRAFGDRSDVEGMVSVDGDVLVRLTGATASTGEPDGPPDVSQAWSTPSMLLRLGLLADRQVFAGNWDAISHVLVAAPSGHGADAVLEALLASLVARRSPAGLGLIVIGRPHSLPDELLGVSHVLEPPVDPHDESATLEVIHRLRHELDYRMANCPVEQPDIVLVVPELADLSAEHHAALGAIMLHGPRQGIRLLAASGRRAADLVLDCPLLPEFGTRLVLRAADEEESIALLGSGDATELGSGGHLLVRIEGRVPVQALGYRVAPDRLAGLVALIKERGTTGHWWARIAPSARRQALPAQSQRKPKTRALLTTASKRNRAKSMHQLCSIKRRTLPKTPPAPATAMSAPKHRRTSKQRWKKQAVPRSSSLHYRSICRRSPSTWRMPTVQEPVSLTKHWTRKPVCPVPTTMPMKAVPPSLLTNCKLVFWAHASSCTTAKSSGQSRECLTRRRWSCSSFSESRTPPAFAPTC